MKATSVLIAILSLFLLNACAEIKAPVTKIENDTVSQHADLDYIQNLTSRKTLSLNGEWARIIDPYENGYYNHRYQPHENGYFKNAKMKSSSDLIEYNFDTAPKIDVPSDWNSQEPELTYYEGTIWYHKNFSLTKNRDRKYVLEFGAVNYEALVYVNGIKVGSHEGGFTSFQFDISDQLRDGENFVTVKADNSRARDQVPTVNTDWWNYGGITRSVSLVELPKAHVQDYTVILSPDRKYITGRVHVTHSVEGEAVSVSIPKLEISKALKLDVNGVANFSIAASPTLWTPENPVLYQVDIAYEDDHVSDKIGFRTIEVDGDKLLLNGQSVFLRGISIHEESLLHPGRAWSEADARATLGLTKELGANFVRLAHYPHNETMLKMADELGLMVWSEIPVYWTVLFDDPNVYSKAEKQLVEMITRDKNRASIVMWSVANETPLSESRLIFLDKLIDKARQMDPSRLITAAIDTHDVSANEIMLKDPLAKLIDVIGINSYCGWYWGSPKDCSEKTWKSEYGKPIMMSEMGGGAKQGKFGAEDEIWTEEFQALIYRENLEMASNIKGLRGISPWILKDFRSPRRSLDNIQDGWNRKGLVSETGIKKKAWTELKTYYEDKKAALEE